MQLSQSVLPLVPEHCLQVKLRYLWVGGLLGINNTFLKDRGVVTDNFDKKENGVYNMQMSNSSEDAPSGAYLYGTMIVFGNAFVTQIYIPYDKGLMYIRQYYNYSSVWSRWRKTDLSIV